MLGALRVCARMVSNSTDLVERAEFELRSGLQATLRPTMVTKRISARPLRNRGDSVVHAEIVVYTRRESKATPLVVPVPGQLLQTPRTVSCAGRRPCNSERLDQVRREKGSASH